MALFAQTVLAVLGVYLAIGVVVGIAFVVRGVDRIDPAMAASPKRVRALILPGAVALWPVMLAKWARAPRPMTTDAREAGHA